MATVQFWGHPLPSAGSGGELGVTAVGCLDSTDTQTLPLKTDAGAVSASVSSYGGGVEGDQL